jgi:hypothetical protein
MFDKIGEWLWKCLCDMLEDPYAIRQDQLRCSGDRISQMIATTDLQVGQTALFEIPATVRRQRYRDSGTSMPSR